jgi:hypothetical protein
MSTIKAAGTAIPDATPNKEPPSPAKLPRPELRAARQAVTKAAKDVTQGRPLDGLTEVILALNEILKSLEAAHD